MARSARRIAIVTADLRPGVGGIGDYSLCFAEGLAQAGVTTGLFALAAQGDAEAGLLSLPASLNPALRAERASAALLSFQPDCVFLQMAPDLYGPAPLPLLAGALQGQRLAVMVHETGALLSDPPEQAGGDPSFFGALRALQAAMVFTTNPPFQSALAAADLPSQLLPLFSHLPVSARQPGAWLDQAFKEAGLAREGNWLLIGLFGRVRDDWSAEESLGQISATAAELGRQPLLLIFGQSQLTAARLQTWRDRHPDLCFLTLGSQPAERLVALLNVLHLLLTPTPLAYLGKASTAAAAAAQGVPIFVGAGAPQLDRPPAFQGAPIIPLGGDLRPALAREPGSGPFRPQRADTIRRFLVALDLQSEQGPGLAGLAGQCDLERQAGS
ncbi:MAG: hypothetical protein AAFY02_16610 [Pseudomonadota bacterium]